MNEADLEAMQRDYLILGEWRRALDAEKQYRGWARQMAILYGVRVGKESHHADVVNALIPLRPGLRYALDPEAAKALDAPRPQLTLVHGGML